MKKDIEPEDNIERSSQSEFDYDTELDTNEKGNTFFNNSNNTSFEAQEKMLGGSLTRESKNNSKQSGGIKCLRDFRKNKPNKMKQISRKKKKVSLNLKNSTELSEAEELHSAVILTN